MIIENLKIVFEKNKNADKLYLRNLLKEELQYYVLNYIYNSSYGENFLFKGGTCLRFCFDLPRVSEDLDFDVVDYGKFDFELFVKDLKKYFSQKLKFDDLEVKISGKNKIIYLKFPILVKVGFPLSELKPSEDVLFLRIDLAPVPGKYFSQEVSLKSVKDFSFVIKRYSLPDLFSGKIAAILGREAFVGKEMKPRFKGRDFFDIFWLNEKGIVPNLKYLNSLVGFGDEKRLAKMLKEKFEEARKSKIEIKRDILPFFYDKRFVDSFIDNFDAFVKDFLAVIDRC